MVGNDHTFQVFADLFLTDNADSDPDQKEEQVSPDFEQDEDHPVSTLLGEKAENEKEW